MVFRIKRAFVTEENFDEEKSVECFIFDFVSKINQFFVSSNRWDRAGARRSVSTVRFDRAYTFA
jgi:hypothetical protein